MLNTELSERDAVVQLNFAREKITELELQIQQIQEDLKLFKKFERERENKIPCNIDFMYYQLVFLRHANEKFMNIVVKNNRIVRLEAIVPKI